jgi:hypothetical protein
MSNFDLKKFLAEGKLYKENLADTRMEAERNARIFHKDLVTKYGFDAVADALEAAFDNAEEGGMGYENIADTFKMDNSILIDMIEDTLSEAISKPTKMKMSELKKKIRQEILAELDGAETEGPDGENVDPVAEATKDGDGEVPAKDTDTDIDIEDKEEVKVDVEKKPKMSGPSNKFLDQLEVLKKEADAMGDNKLERQIDNTITYFTRQHIAKDIDESIELEEADRDYYDAAERDDAAHIAALEKDMEDDKRSSLNEAKEDEVPLTSKVKSFINKAISDAKKDGEFENLKKADWFENELIDMLIELFEDKDYDRASKEVKDYIKTKTTIKESLEILRMKKLAGLITEGEYTKALLRENIEQDILDFWGTQQDDAAQSDGEYEAEWDTQFFIEEYPEYKGKEEEINNIVKKYKI